MVLCIPGDTLLITHIGIGVASSLVCNTSNVCCRGANNPNEGGLGEWYFLNGTIVPRLVISPNGDFTTTIDGLIKFI